MFSDTIKYKDFNGEEHEDTLYFNLSKAECLELELGTSNGIKTYLEEVLKNDKRRELIDFFKEILGMAYGVRSEDGKLFRKSKKARADFEASGAYSEIFVKLSTDDAYATAFMQGAFPQEAGIGVIPENAAPVVPMA